MFVPASIARLPGLGGKQPGEPVSGPRWGPEPMGNGGFEGGGFAAALKTSLGELENIGAVSPDASGGAGRSDGRSLD